MIQKTIIVCENYVVEDTPVGGTVFASANVTGYRYASIFVEYRRPFPNDVRLHAEPSCLDITNHEDGMGNNWGRTINLGVSSEWGSLVSTDLEVGTSYLAFRAMVANGDVELTIVLYCYN